MKNPPSIVVAVLALSASALFARDPIVISKVIHSDGPALHLTLSSKQWMKITNFTQTDRDDVPNNPLGSVVVFQGAAGLPGARVLVATQSKSTQVPHEDIFIAGPTVVYVGPVPNATLFISYHRGSN